MSNKKQITILEMERSSLEFKKTHKVPVYGPFDDNEVPKWFDKFLKERFEPLEKAFIESQNTIPKWFDKFYKEEFKPLKEAFIKSQTQSPVWFKEFVDDVFKPAIASLNARLDNIVKLNNLKE